MAGMTTSAVSSRPHSSPARNRGSGMPGWRRHGSVRAMREAYTDASGSAAMAARRVTHPGVRGWTKATHAAANASVSVRTSGASSAGASARVPGPAGVA
jgi:hypothetical protein